MTNQTQVSAELSEAVERLAFLAEACKISGLDHLPVVSRKNAASFGADLRAVLAERTAMAALITEMQADMSGKTVMSEEAFRELHGKAERLSALEADAQRYRYLRDHCSSHYPMTHEQPAEWSIAWEFQQRTPDEAVGTFDTWIDADIAWMEEQEALLTKEQTRG